MLDADILTEAGEQLQKAQERIAELESDKRRYARLWKEEVLFWLAVIIEAAAAEDGMDGSWADMALRRTRELERVELEGKG